jgi:hypothetical protein
MMTGLAYHLAVGQAPPDPELVRAIFLASVDRFVRGFDGSEDQLAKLAEIYREIVLPVFNKSSFENAMRMELS